MPLRSDSSWLDWDCAVTITGHDLEVKQTYLALINSRQRPELYIDIGANYGTHSLLFLTEGINTLTFEPNSSCHGYFIDLCELNGVAPQIEPVALGQTDGFVKLSYPERHTWLGSTAAHVIENLAATHELVVETVERKRLDDYLPAVQNRDTLIKIDAEGNELAVLQGAETILRQVKPKVIFESWQGSGRAEISRLFQSYSYRIFLLPWDPAAAAEPLAPSQFLSAAFTNFIAVPRLLSR